VLCRASRQPPEPALWRDGAACGGSSNKTNVKY
jgi:hypothetical protein